MTTEPWYERLDEWANRHPLLGTFGALAVLLTAFGIFQLLLS